MDVARLARASVGLRQLGMFFRLGTVPFEAARLDLEHFGTIQNWNMTWIEWLKSVRFDEAVPCPAYLTVPVPAL